MGEGGQTKTQKIDDVFYERPLSIYIFLSFETDPSFEIGVYVNFFTNKSLICMTKFCLLVT